MKGTLLLSILNIRSNSIDGKTLPAGDLPETDTAQWWITADKSYSTTTYALSRTFRTIVAQGTPDQILPVAIDSLEKSLGSTTTKHIRIDIDNLEDGREVISKLAKHGLEPTLAMVDNTYPIWRFGEAPYQLDEEQKASFGQKLLEKMFRRLNELKSR